MSYAVTKRATVPVNLFSRYVAGWMVTMRESAELAKRLIEESCQK